MNIQEAKKIAGEIYEGDVLHSGIVSDDEGEYIIIEMSSGYFLGWHTYSDERDALEFEDDPFSGIDWRN